MNISDNEIYNSEEYKARIDRNHRSLCAICPIEALKTAAESIAYWQMRTVVAEQLLFDEGYESFGNRSPRTE